MESDLLLFASQGLFTLIFILVLRDFLRHRDVPRFEVLVLFGILAFGLAPLVVFDAIGISVPGAEPAGLMLLVSQPAVFLRLVTHFRPVPRYQQYIAIVALLASWIILLSYRSSLPTSMALVVVGLFVYVEVYATFALFRAARDTAGVSRIRARAIIAGSASLGLAFLLLGVGEAVPSSRDLTTALIVLLIMASAVAYYLGFAPPRRLRRLIQEAAVWRAYNSIAEQAPETSYDQALGNVMEMAIHAVGGNALWMAVGQPDADKPYILAKTEMSISSSLAEAPTIPLDDVRDPLVRAVRDQTPAILTSGENWSPHLERLGGVAGEVRAALVAPLVGHDGLLGLLIILLERHTAFLDDDLEVLAMLAERASVSLENRRLFESVHQQVTNRQLLLELSGALADELEASAVAGEIAANVAKLIPAASWGVLLPAPDGSLEIVSTGGCDAETRLHRRIPRGAGVTGTAFRSGETVVIDDVRESPDYVGMRSGVLSELAVPLRNHGESIGVINFERTEVAAFTPEEVALAQIVAHIAAQALARARLIEQLQHQNVALDTANRHKSEFLASMSHELRTPLNSIIGFSELLVDAGGDGYDPATRQNFLETIHSSGHHLLSLINDILDLSKVEAGHMELVLEQVDVHELVAQTLGTLQPLANRSSVELMMDVESPTPFVVDAGKLKQILYNLLSNAIKFTPQGGTVTVSTHRKPDGLLLSVADTGIGIASEDRERIFREFQQIDVGPDRHFEGTGLGLALTRRFVELHGGRIWVESEVGAGSTFFVSLREHELPERPPFEPVEGAVPTAVDDGLDEAGRPLVLVVEDDARAANLLTLYLRRGGYRTRIAINGEQALELARELQPDAITLDILLPTLDGWEVLRVLKRNVATRDIPVIIASVADDRELGFALGATDYFVKPIERDALLARLDRFAFSRRARFGGVQVLVVDDEAASVELLAGMLEPIGFNVIRAGTGEEGIRLAAEQTPDLMLLDLMMPGVSGFDVVDAVRANPDTQDMPILVVTAKDISPEDKQRLNGRVTALLQKGTFAAVDLVAWLDRTLEQIEVDAGRRNTSD